MTRNEVIEILNWLLKKYKEDNKVKDAIMISIQSINDGILVDRIKVLLEEEESKRRNP